MRDVLDRLDAWIQDGEELAVATVIQTWGSAPRPVGSKMIVTRSGGIAGSVSAGCVEGAVVEESQAVMAEGRPRLLKYGVADEEAWQVGLACGGTIHVFVEPGKALNPIYTSLKQHLADRAPLAVVGVLAGPPEQLNRKLIVLPDGTTQGDLDLKEQAGPVVQSALENLAQGISGVLALADGTELFVEVYPLPPRLIIVGAVHLAEPLVTIAGASGFESIIVDPRRAFAVRERFPQAAEVLQEWPQDALPNMVLDSSAHVVVLTHDPKLDDPALMIALKSGARYVGALGSRRTNEKRQKRLRKAGLDDEQIARLHAPIGLDLGGRSTGEIAISIMAEVIQVRNGKSR
ncbi:MAG TPA: XdhC family protein [Anaerolineales bacterium]